MNVEKIKKILYKMMLIILLILVLYSTYCSVFKIYKAEETLNPIILILGTIICVFTFVSINKILKKSNEKYSNYIAIALTIVFFIALAFFGNKVTSIPPYDLIHIQSEVNSMLEHGKQIIGNYFNRYSSQIPMTILIYYICKLGNILGVTDVKAFTIVIHALFIAITAFFTYLSVKKVKNSKVALTTLIFFIINPIFYLYSSYFYSDTLCMPFVAIAIYLFIIGQKEKNIKKSVIMYLLSGIILAIGFKIRVVVAILLIAIILGIVLKENINKKVFIKILNIIIGFIIGLLLFKLAMMPFKINVDKQKEIPITHWIMMSLNEETNGEFSSKDYDYTRSIEGYKEKEEANIEKIKSRLQNLGINGWLKLSLKKIQVNWSNGDYDYIDKLKNVEEINSLYNYVSGNKKVFILYYLQILKITSMTIIAIIIINEIKKKKNDYSVILISLFGAFLFYLIWEVRARYSLSFLPWIILIFGMGITQVEKLLDLNILTYRNKKINIEILKKILIILIIALSIVLLTINYKSYTIDEKQFFDMRVVQTIQSKNDNKKIKTDKIEQTFKTNKEFNEISIKLKKNNNQIETHYKLELLDKKGKVIVNKEFTSNEVVNGDYKKFHFKTIKPKGNNKYTIKIYSLDATEDNTLEIGRCKQKNFNAYRKGTLIINGKKKRQDMAFKVYNNVSRPTINNKVYIIMSALIIIIEGFAFYPYLKTTKIKKEEEE